MAIYGHIWSIYGHIWSYMDHIWPYGPSAVQMDVAHWSRDVDSAQSLDILVGLGSPGLIARAHTRLHSYAIGFACNPFETRLSIGHFLISQAVFDGIEKTINTMRLEIDNSQKK